MFLASFQSHLHVYYGQLSLFPLSEGQKAPYAQVSSPCSPLISSISEGWSYLQYAFWWICSRITISPQYLKQNVGYSLT